MNYSIYFIIEHNQHALVPSERIHQSKHSRVEATDHTGIHTDHREGKSCLDCTRSRVHEDIF
jgi:hypothetical protein